MHPWWCLWAELEQDILVSWTFPKPCEVFGLPSGEESKGEVSSGWVFSCSHLICRRLDYYGAAISGTSVPVIHG